MTREAVIVLRMMLNGESEVSAENAAGRIEKLLVGGRLNPKSAMYPALLQAIEEVATLDPFSNPAGEWLFGTGVLNEGLLGLKHLTDETLIHAAMRLYGRLVSMYPLWVEITNPVRSVSTDPAPIEPFGMPSLGDASDDPDADDVGTLDTKESRIAELMQILVDRMGYDPESADTPLRDLAEEMYRREQALARGNQ